MIYKIFGENQNKGIFDSPYPIYWIKRHTLEKLWSKDEDYLAPGEESYLKSTYFSYSNLDGYDLEEPILYCGRASLIEENGSLLIRFNGGRHRSRWMLDLGIDLIPLGLKDNSIPANNFTFGKVKKGDTIELPVSIADIRAEKIEYDNLCKINW